MTYMFQRSLIAGVSTLGLMAGAAQADQVINDDLIVTQSICVGQDCVNGESFGFDTIRLKENNLRIKFQDTSVSASFPTVDWQLTANDSTNGGTNRFSIESIDNSAVPFTVEYGAGSHSLYVDDGGRIGLGTSAPVLEMHMVSGDSPTLRLEQDGSSGFTPQTWDVAGNETNFFVRDATNSSRIPFKIRPSAPTNSLYVDTDGDIGLGTASPDAGLHVIGGSTNALLVDATDGGAAGAFAHFRTIDATNTTPIVFIEDTTSVSAIREMLRVKNQGGSFITMENTATTKNWFMVHENSAPNRFLISHSDTVNPQFAVDASGNAVLEGTLTTGGGTCGGGCDLVFAPETERLSIEEHASLMWENRHLPNVGPTVENAPINVSDKLGRMLNELEHAHIYIDELNQRLSMLEETLTRRQ